MFEINLSLRPFTQELLPWLLDTAIRSSVLLLAALLIALALRPRSAAHRHLLWTAAIVGALAMPFVSHLAPPLEIGWSIGAPARSVVSAVPAAVAEAPAAVRDVPTVTAAPAAVAPAADTGDRTEVAPAAVVAAPADGHPGQGRDRPEAGAVTGFGSGSGGSSAAPGSNAGAGFVPSTAGPTRSSGGPFLAIPSIVTVVWAAGSLFVLGGMIVGMLRLRWLARGSSRVRGGPLDVACRRACLRLGLHRRVGLLQGDDTTMPMTWGIRHPVLVLPAGAESWERERLDGVLLHELGHVARGDWLAQAAAQLACALYWFNPLVWIAAHRMRIEREHACDDLVVSTGHEASRYAGDLVDLARALRPPRLREGLAMIRGSHLRRRLLAILDHTRDRRAPSRGRTALTYGAVLIAALAISMPRAVAADLQARPDASDTAVVATDAGPSVTPDRALSPDAADTRLPASAASRSAWSSGAVDRALPDANADRGLRDAATAGTSAPAAQQAMTLCDRGDGEARRRMSMTNDDVRTVEMEYERCRSSVRIEGEIEFTEDFSAIRRLESGARLRLEVDRDGSSRRILLITPGPGGRAEYDWTVGGQRQPFDADGERWLASALVDLFRSTSYKARERAAWILSERGPAGVLSEVELMLADHAQATYLSILLEEADLSSDQVRQAIELAGREIESDHSLGEFLVSAAGRFPLDGPARTAFLRAARSLGSDHEQGRVFQTALATGGLSRSDLELLLETAAESIGSDHTLGELLRDLAARYPLEPAIRGPFLRAASTIGSDHTAGEVYRVVLEQPSLRPAELAEILTAAREIDSDHTLSELLIELAGRGLSDSSAQRAFLDTARTIGSDHSLATTLTAFLRMEDVREREQIEMLVTAREIGSDHSLGEVLIEFAARYPVAGQVREAFLATMDGIGSRHQRERVSRAIDGR